MSTIDKLMGTTASVDPGKITLVQAHSKGVTEVIKRHDLKPVNGCYHLTRAMMEEVRAIDEGKQPMSKYGDELQRRLDTPSRQTWEIVEWYLGAMATDAAMFSLVERKFWEDIIALYLKGQETGPNFGGCK
jgi:hypothetical protein